ncbi:MAG: hypothetical protein AAFY27_01770 [Pseudomonadota bacterium]
MKVTKTIFGAVIGAIITHAVVFFGAYGFSLIYPETAPALSLVVPLAVAPFAALVGALVGGWFGYRTA